MDKYEFNIKVEQIKKLVTKGDFTTSMKIADTIDWRRVRNPNLLAMISQVYEKNGEYQEARDILLQAYERAPVGKRLLFKLSELSLRVGNIQDAEDYYREFCSAAPGDPRQNLLRYLILKAKGASSRQLISPLEQYVSTELDERWMYELAELYAAVGEKNLCVQMCDKIALMFAFGKYVDKALALKAQYASLSDYQRDLVQNPDKYEAQYKAVEQEFENGALSVPGESEQSMEEHFSSEMQFPDHDYGNGAQDTDEPIYGEDAYAQGYEGQENDTPGEPAGYSRADEELVANLHQAAAEEQLAREMSRLTRDGIAEEEVPGEQTKKLYDIHRALPPALRAEQPATGFQYSSMDKGAAGGLTNSVDISEEEVPGSGYAEEDNAAPGGGYSGGDNAVSGGGYSGRDNAVSGGGYAGGDNAVSGGGYAEEDNAAPGGGYSGGDNAVPGSEYAEEDNAVPGGEYAEKNGAGRDKEADGTEETAGEAGIAGEEQVPRLMAIETRTPEKGVEEAIGQLKAFHTQHNSHNQTVKITGSKLSSRGVDALSAQLAGRDLIVDEAGDLVGEELEKLVDRMTSDGAGDTAVVLLDNPRQMEELYQNYPREMEKFTRIDGETVLDDGPAAAAPVPQEAEQEYGNLGKEEPEAYERQAAPGEEEWQEETAEIPDQSGDAVTEVPGPEQRADDYRQEMDPDSFAQYACDYAARIDCSITGKSMLALYERVELMEEDGIPLTRENAEAMIEEAADKAEKPSLGHLITGVFSPKYNKEGLLILREGHFI